MNTSNSALPRWGKLAAGGVMLTIAATAGAVSFAVNVIHGLEAGLASGITFGLADIGKLVIPVVAGVVGWNGQLRATAVVCVLVSLWCATNYYADRHGADLLAKERGVSAYASKAKEISEMEAEVASLRDLAKQEGARGGCKQNCRDLLAKADSAALRLATARTAKAGMKPAEVSGLAVMVAMTSGGAAEKIVRGIGAVKAALFLALVEVLVWLSLPAVALLASAMKKVPAAKAKPKAKRKVATKVARTKPAQLLPAPTLRLGAMSRRPEMAEVAA